MKRYLRKLLGVLCFLLALCVLSGIAYLCAGWDGVQAMLACLAVAGSLVFLVIWGINLCLE